MLYKVLKRMAAKGMPPELREKIDTLYALDRLTEEQYRELVGAEEG